MKLKRDKDSLRREPDAAESWANEWRAEKKRLDRHWSAHFFLSLTGRQRPFFLSVSCFHVFLLSQRGNHSVPIDSYCYAQGWRWTRWKSKKKKEEKRRGEEKRREEKRREEKRRRLVLWGVIRFVYRRPRIAVRDRLVEYDLIAVGAR